MSVMNYLGINTAYAATKSTAVTAFVGRVNEYIVNPLIILMFAVALLFFLYGVVEFIINSDKADERELGKSHIMWGIIGMFVMASAWGVIYILCDFFCFDVIVFF